jgi:DNA-binding PadR family transcriptional regulator
MPKPNLTLHTGLVLQAISLGVRHGFDIMEATGLPSGTVYPALRRLESAGCLSSEWEDDDEGRKTGRPVRCYYTLRPEGHALLKKALERFPAIALAVDVRGGSHGDGNVREAVESKGPSPEPGKA